MTPDFLRGIAVAQIVGIMHTAHEAGPWSLITVETGTWGSTLVFAVGVIYPDREDDRKHVEITVKELP